MHACSLAYKEDFRTYGNMDMVGRPTGSVGLVAEPLVVNTWGPNRTHIGGVGPTRSL